MPLHLGTSITARGCSDSRKCRVSSSLNLGSVDSMHRKNLSRLAKLKLGTLNSGWYGVGRPLRINMPSTAERTAPRIVISNVIGINAGQLLGGRPPTFQG